jgi:tetratricopeptide (TPR) repeat protein
MAGVKEVTLQLLPVHNESRQPHAEEWARLVEYTYLPNELADKANVVVFHQGAGHSEADFGLNGEIVQEESLFVLQLRLQEPGSGRIRYATTASFVHPDELRTATAAVCRNILLFLQIRVLNKDLEPWMPRTLSDSTSIAFLKAMTYILSGEPGGGVFLNEALRLDSTFVAPRVWLIPSLLRSNTRADREEAEKHYRVLKSLESRVTPFELAMIELAGCYLHGNLQCRVAALEKGLRFAPGNRIVLENLGLAYDRLEKFDQAADAYAPVVRSGFLYPPTYPEYARVLIKTGRTDEARTVLDRALTVRPVGPETYELLTALAWKDGDSAKARSLELRALEGVAGHKRSWGDVHEDVGKSLVDLGETDKALQLLRAAVAEKPGSASAHSALAIVLISSGDTAGRKQEAESALELEPSCTEAHALLGRLYQERGFLEQAGAHFRKYLERDSVTVTAFEIQRRLGRE